MTVTINGTTGVAGVDGTAATPAIQGNDTNTGIFFPAADTIAFAEGGAEVARFDSSGNLGIGTSSPATILHAFGSSPVIRSADNGTGIAQFNARNTTANCSFGIDTSTGSITGSANAGYIYNATNTPLVFYTNASERMRITNTGAVFFLSLAAGAGTNALRWSTSTGQMTYDTSSAKYKDNIRDSVYGLNHVMQMRSAQFEYKDDGRSDVGFIAEEMQPIVPELVGLDKDGQADSVSYDRMVSVLVKAIQEQQAIITDLKARIETLENK